MERTIIPGAVEGDADPPSSKSYAQRAIAAALLAEGGNGRLEFAGTSSGSGRGEVLQRNQSVLSGIEGCDDTAAALRVVQLLGAQVEQIVPGTYAITGGLNPRADILDIGESGLSTRLFTPIASLCTEPITITGHGTILTRPMDMMIEPLRALGVEVKAKKGRLPITVRGPMRGGEIEIDGSVSSQFLTGLLMALPLAGADTTVRVTNLKSVPYVDMTIAMMDKFGIEIDHRDYEEFYIPGRQKYTPARLTIEGDWSAASCLLVAGATAGRGGGVTVRNLNPVSLQADVAIIEALSRAGALIEQTRDAVKVSRPSGEAPLRPFSFDATDCPDLFPALVALAASCPGTSTITGTRRLAHKESDRAQTLLTEYARLGIEIDLSEPDVMRINGGGNAHGGLFSSRQNGIVVDSHRDHRIAMSLAVAALAAAAPVTITGAESVSKSYADFWHDFDKLTVTTP